MSRELTSQRNSGLMTDMPFSGKAVASLPCAFRQKNEAGWEALLNPDDDETRKI